ncbi:MAG: TraM recognition domain-containing protein, partial [Aureliella sp.]
IPLTLVVAANYPLLVEAAAKRDQAVSDKAVTPVFDEILMSPDLTERASIYLGRVVADGSPVLVPKKIFREHAHGLGDSGSGKTSLFLCPVIEQLVRSGDCSVIVLDLKGDSLELLASLESAAEFARKRYGLRMPLRHFSNQADKATFAFNPLSQVFWTNVDLITRTDTLCGACGLSYGADYGEGYYSSANAAILHHALKTFPNIDNFVGLADCIGEVIAVATKRELHPEIRKAGVHVQEVMKSLAACAALNVSQSSQHSSAVFRDSINMVEMFQEPQLSYFHLPSTLSPSAAGAIGRLASYMLLASATQTRRDIPVYLVIDEFQRMVASNLEYMLQLARSMGVGIILANQCMEDLKRRSSNLIPTVEANCRLRQSFAVSCGEDQERLIRSSGVTVDYLASSSESIGSDGQVSESYSEQEQVVNRLTMNDILLTTDHPFRSFLKVSRGEGYSQFGGMTVAIESAYHISPVEYQRRRKLQWPTGEGTFVPKETVQEPTIERHSASKTT